MERRTFVTAALSAASYSRILGANDRIGVAIIGAGGQGRGVWGRFLKQPDVAPIAVCDVYQPHLEKARDGRRQGQDLRRFSQAAVKDRRRRLPDHWHAIPPSAAKPARTSIVKSRSLTIRKPR
jgi:hypothetical protein